jgi:hypothetical protein
MGNTELSEMSKKVTSVKELGEKRIMLLYLMLMMMKHKVKGLRSNEDEEGVAGNNGDQSLRDGYQSS